MKTAALAAACVVASAATAAAQGLGGNYRVAGKNFDGSTYSGTAAIVVTTNTTCRIRWMTGGATAQGICMRNGSSFSAAYRLGNAIGLVIYEIKGDGTLQGLWTIADQSGIGAEILTPLR